MAEIRRHLAELRRRHRRWFLLLDATLGRRAGHVDEHCPGWPAFPALGAPIEWRFLFETPQLEQVAAAPRVDSVAGVSFPHITRVFPFCMPLQ